MLKTIITAIVATLAFGFTTVIAEQPPSPVNGLQSTAQWWGQIATQRLEVEKILQDTYADAERQYGNGSMNSKTAFADILNTTYPGSQVDQSLSGSIVMNGATYKFNSSWSVYKIYQTDGSLQKTYSFISAPTYEVSDGVNSITIVAIDDPAKAHFYNAKIQSIIITAESIFEKRTPHGNVYQFGGEFCPVPGPLAVIMNDIYYTQNDTIGLRMDQYADSMILDETTRNWTLTAADRLYANKNISPSMPTVVGEPAPHLAVGMSAIAMHGMYKIYFLMFAILFLPLIIKLIIKQKK